MNDTAHAGKSWHAEHFKTISRVRIEPSYFHDRPFMFEAAIFPQLRGFQQVFPLQRRDREPRSLIVNTNLLSRINHQFRDLIGAGNTSR